MAKTQQKQSDKKSKLPLWISLGIIAALVALYFLWPGFQEGVKEAWKILKSGDQDKISEWVRQFSFWGPVFIIVFMVLQMFLVVVNVVALMVVAILAYGPFWGSVISISAVVVASTVGYLIGIGLGEAFVNKILGEKTTKKVGKAVEEYGFWAIVIARISPFLSNDAVSFIAGITHMNYLRFMGATLMGIVPLTLLLAWLGGDFERLKTGLIWLSVVSVAGFVAFVVYDKYFRKDKS